MATYTELFSINDSTWRNKIAVAVVTAAYNILLEDPAVVARVTWAQEAIANPLSVAEKVSHLVKVKAQKDVPAITVAQITNADDATVQTFVNAVADALIGE